MREEWLGAWWRAGTESKAGVSKVGGQLTFGKKGVELVLFGSLFDWTGFDLENGVGFPLDPPQTIAVIHGRTMKPMSVLGLTEHRNENWR